MQFILYADGKTETSKTIQLQRIKTAKTPKDFFLLIYSLYYTELKWKYNEQWSSQAYKLQHDQIFHKFLSDTMWHKNR